MHTRETVDVVLRRFRPSDQGSEDSGMSQEAVLVLLRES